MDTSLKVLPSIALGVVPTHIKFVGGLLPDQDGKFPREADGRLISVAEMDRICQLSPVRPTCTQISVFPGADEADGEIAPADGEEPEEARAVKLRAQAKSLAHLMCHR